MAERDREPLLVAESRSESPRPHDPDYVHSDQENETQEPPSNLCPDLSTDSFDVVDFSELQGYKEPNFKPNMLSTGWLVFTLIWLLISCGGVIVVTVFGYWQPVWLHIRNPVSYQAWVYCPLVVGITNGLLFKIVVQQYFVYMPYTEMAKVGRMQTGPSKVHYITISPEITMTELVPNPSTIIRFCTLGHYSDAFLMTLLVVSQFLSPFKSAWIQPVNDTEGWKLSVSYIIGIGLSILYLCMFSCIAMVAFYFYKNKTGLRWNPNSIASRLALVQGSNIFPAFAGTDTLLRRDKLWPIARSWHKKYGTLRCGYWRHRDSSTIIHGIRFIANTLPTTSSIDQSRPAVLRASESRSRSRSSHGNSASSNPSLSLDEPEDLRPADDANARKAFTSLANRRRFGSLWLSDVYIVLVFLVGFTTLVISLVYLGKGQLWNAGVYSTDPKSTFFKVKLGLVFNFLPSLLFAAFNNCFVTSDLYHRVMLPIRNMSRLPHGASAKDSVLLDYLSPDPITGFIAALGGSEWRISWGIFLANTCQFAHLIFNRIFIFGDTLENGQIFFADRANSVLSLCIMGIYCCAIWVARPYGSMRTCFPTYNLIWTVALFHQSPILRCPEFWAQEQQDDEDHLKARVTLADRKFRFGGFIGLDNKPHLGIVPVQFSSWENPPKDNLKCLRQSTRLASASIQTGIYCTDTYNTANKLMAQLQLSQHEENSIWELAYDSWTTRMLRIIDRIFRKRTAEPQPRRQDTETADEQSSQPALRLPDSISLQEIQRPSASSVQRDMSDIPLTIARRSTWETRNIQPRLDICG